MRMSRLDADIRCSVYQRFCIGWRYDKMQRAMKRAEWNDWLVMMRAAKSELEGRTGAHLSDEANVLAQIPGPYVAEALNTLPPPQSAGA